MCPKGSTIECGSSQIGYKCRSESGYFWSYFPLHLILSPMGSVQKQNYAKQRNRFVTNSAPISEILWQSQTNRLLLGGSSSSRTLSCMSSRCVVICLFKIERDTTPQTRRLNFVWLTAANRQINFSGQSDWRVYWMRHLLRTRPPCSSVRYPSIIHGVRFAENANR